MTLDQFIAELEKTPRDWRVDSIGTLTRLHGNHCPISAVAYARGCNNHNMLLPHAAAAELGLTEMRASRVIRAADRPRKSALRSRLLAACGIKEGR